VSRGPWAAAVVAAVAGDDEGLGVTGLRVEEGTVSAAVEGCDVSFAAPVVPQRLWAAMWRFARGNGPLEAAVEGREQSDHLEHLLLEDWDVALVPERVASACSCDGPAGCAHAAALARAFADAVDADPSALLRGRGCTPERARQPLELLDDDDEQALAPPEEWEAGPLPPARARRPMPAGAVLKRLGPVGVRVGDRDLAEVLQAAYEAFGSMPNEPENVSPGSSTSSPSPD
jgi:uncharacterized Zn finger protein